MAFWGIEVKPGKPFTHSFDSVRGRLHISQATLAIGSSKKTSLVQCNIGNRSPVLLCALLPDKTESLQLNLEFEEADEVVFSVIGPRGIYLTGYYLCHSQHSNLDDDSESHGEDIANTDTEGSIPRSEEDEYEDSFIDDDDPEVLPPSPVSTDGVDEVVDVNKLRDKKHTHKRLKKKCQAVESDDDTSSWQLNTGSCIRSVPEIEGEDSFPISSIYKNKRAAKNIVLDAGRDKANKERIDTGNRMVEEDDIRAKSKNSDAYVTASKGEVETLVKDDESKRITEDKAQQGEAKTNNIGQDLVASNEPDHEPGTNNRGSNLPNDSIFTSTELGPANGVKSKKKRKERSKERRILEADNSNHIKAIEENKSQQANKEADNMIHDLLERSERDQRPTNNMEIGLSPDSLLPSVEVSAENILKKKKRRKELSVAKSHEGNGTSSDVFGEDGTKQDEVKTNSMDNDLHERNEREQKPSDDKIIDIVSQRIADENISEKKIKKKKKRKSKIQEDDENVKVDVPILSKEEKERSIMEFDDKNVDIGSSQARTLSNGLIIEELELGKSDGKAAAPGKKLKVLYTAKLNEGGQVIDTNIGKAPYRFKLGDQQVIEGWTVGLDGMRVGGKRRLIIPPSMGYGNQGIAENVPPNSWLVYDIELMSVR